MYTIKAFKVRSLGGIPFTLEILLMQTKKSLISKLSQHVTSLENSQDEELQAVDRKQEPEPEPVHARSSVRNSARQQKLRESFRLIQEWKENEEDIICLTGNMQRSLEKTTYLQALMNAHQNKYILWQKIEHRLLEG